MTLISYLISQKIAEVNSSYNGKIIVYESQGKKYISVGNLIQSGSYLERIWKKALRRFKLKTLPLQRVLVLGLAGGTFVHLLKKMSPYSTIEAVEIDPVMVEIGKTYFQLDTVSQLTIHTEDAEKFVQKNPNSAYNLVFVDLFFGYSMPLFLESKDFLKNINAIVTVGGCVIFNRMYTQNAHLEAEKFLDKLKEIFDDITVIKVGTNHVFFAHKKNVN